MAGDMAGDRHHDMGVGALRIVYGKAALLQLGLIDFGLIDWSVLIFKLQPNCISGDA